MNRVMRQRLDRLADRLAPRGTLTKAEAHELAALEAEYDSLPPFEAMSHAELDEWHRIWGCGARGARLDELRQRARTPEECRADEERAATFSAMSEVEIDAYLSGAFLQGRDQASDDEEEQVAATVAANRAYLARSREKRDRS